MELNLELNENETVELDDACGRLSATREAFALAAMRRHLLHTRRRLTREAVQLRAAEAHQRASDLPVGTRFTLMDLVAQESWWVAMHQLDHKRIGKAFRSQLRDESIASHVDRQTNNLAIYERR